MVGAAAALAVARSGLRVALLERSPFAAAGGSSKGTARIYAPAAYPDNAYLEAALRALESWRALEAASGQRLLWPTGALHRGAFAERQLEALRAAGAEAQAVSAREARRRFGVEPAGDAPLVHQPDAGVIRADRARAALLAAARAAGADLRDGEQVLELAPGADSVAIRTDRARWACAAAIVTAGPWARGLLAGAGIECPLEVSLQTVAYFELADRAAPPVALIDYEGDEPYACWDPARGLKAAFHALGPAVEPGTDGTGGQPDAAVVERVTRWLAASYPGTASTKPAADTCMYTNAPGERFVLERHGRIVVGSACSGHGFQFAPETGERLARLAAEVAAPELQPAGGRR